MNNVTVWRTLFLLLLTINITVLTSGVTDYSSRLGPLHSALADEFESALQADAMYGRYSRASQDAVPQLQAMKPPFWKKGKHFEYTALAVDLKSMEHQVMQQVVTSTDSLRASYSKMPNMKQSDIDRIVKTMEDNAQRQKAARERLIPKYKEKLERFKVLGKSLS